MKRFKTIPPALMLALGLLSAFPQAAWSQTTGTIKGFVTAAGEPLSDVNILVEGIRRGSVSGPDGQFEITALDPGTYVLQASFIGYETLIRSVAVQAGKTTRVDFVLTPGAAGLEEVLVEGRAANLVGLADAASQGRVGQAQLEPRPLLRVGEVLETVPGTIVTQHSGSGKANQFFLRGFNLDHGTDFSASVEGAPINLPTHAHGQGYLDLNFLIPELIERISYEKGPYNAEGGDFSTAGSARIELMRHLDAGIAKVETGSDKYYEGLFANSSEVGGGDLLYAMKGRYYDGPWVNPENSGMFSGIVKYSGGGASDGYSLTALGYYNDWEATDQIALRAVDQDQISRFGALDHTDGGSTGRYTLAGSWWNRTPGGARTQANAYAAYYHLNLFSNFTYLLENPEQGDQFEQADRRLYAGGKLSHQWFTHWFGLGNTNKVGAELRHDQIFEVALFQTNSRKRLGAVRDDRVAESSLGAYLENETQWTRKLRTVFGLRGDVYRFDVRSDIGINSGTDASFILSPKFNLALGPWRGAEGYLNLGLGYHSNDARGATIRVDPSTREAIEQVDPLVRTRGAEIGARTGVVPGLQSTVALWYIGLESELVFVGDAGGTEPSRASEHYGIEWNNYYNVTDWLHLNLDVALTESRFTEDDPEGNEIENSIGRTITGGIYAGRPTGWLASLQVRHFGPRPLTADGSVRSESTTLVNLKAAYRFAKVAVALDVLNLADSEDSDVSYFYGSRLEGEPLEGIEDVHFHPVIPRTFRLSAAWRF